MKSYRSVSHKLQGCRADLNLDSYIVYAVGFSQHGLYEHCNMFPLPVYMFVYIFFGCKIVNSQILNG